MVRNIPGIKILNTEKILNSANLENYFGGMPAVKAANRKLLPFSSDYDDSYRNPISHNAKYVVVMDYYGLQNFSSLMTVRCVLRSRKVVNEYDTLTVCILLSTRTYIVAFRIATRLIKRIFFPGGVKSQTLAGKYNTICLL